MFPKPKFQAVLSDFVEARLHNDRGTMASERIMELQDEMVGHRALPVYLSMDPTSREILGHFELPALGNKEDAIFEFLSEQQQKWKARHPAPAGEASSGDREGVDGR